MTSAFKIYLAILVGCAAVLVLQGGAVGLALLGLPVILVHWYLRELRKAWAWALLAVLLGAGTLLLGGALAEAFIGDRWRNEMASWVPITVFAVVTGGFAVSARAVSRRAARRS